MIYSSKNTRQFTIYNRNIYAIVFGRAAIILHVRLTIVELLLLHFFMYVYAIWLSLFTHITEAKLKL